jgi:dTDP-4-amino-4,6-dideoxygalactose transaminase
VHTDLAVPFVDLKAQYQQLKPLLLERIEQVLDGMQLFLGPNVEALEREFASFSGTRYAVGVDSGTSALALSLRALGIGPGDEVITVANTFVATAGAIVETGARPVFVDVDPGTQLMDLALVEGAITARTKAILPVHLYGRLVDMARLNAVAQRHGLAVVEDACQAHGARLDGRAAGAWGSAAAFSFYFSKNLGAYGEAGMVTTDDPEVDRQVRLLRDHGSPEKYRHATFGRNARLDELQAAVLRVKLPLLDQWNEARRRHAAAYREALDGLPGLTCLAPEAGTEHVHHLFVVRTRARDALAAALREAGIASGCHYPIPIHKQEAWSAWGGRPVHLPQTEAAADEILSLPIYPELTDHQRGLVVDAVRSFSARSM